MQFGLSQTLLKINRILAGRLIHQPSRSMMPTTNELNSFRIELCTPPRPSLVKRRKISIRALSSATSFETLFSLTLPRKLSSEDYLNQYCCFSKKLLR